MRRIGFAALIVTVVPVSGAVADSASERCDLPETKWMGELQAVLSRRAVGAINLAAESQAGNPALGKLVDPSATFASGSGDVGMPLGVGVAGARTFARHMNADSFRFLPWSSIPMPTSDTCGAHEVDVEFVRQADQVLFPVKFSFRAGRIVAAQGWRQPFVSGPIKTVRD